MQSTHSSFKIREYSSPFSRGSRSAVNLENSEILRALRHGDATILAMSDAYNELLDAAIQHLESLKAQGVRHLAVSPESLAGLNQAARPAASPARTQIDRMPEKSATPPALPQAAENRRTPGGSRSGELMPAAATRPSISPATSTRQSPAEPAGKADLPLDLPGETSASPAAPLSPEAKLAAFADLRQRAMACVKCPNLAAARKNVVFGVGNINAELMFVGEAPGADEDIQGEPFVGKAGQLLTKIVQTMGLSRDQVYIGNILKCRPDTPGQTAGNRKPTPEEMQTCIPFLHEQIDLIRPRVIVALGATAVEGLLGKTIGITRLRGNWKTYRGTPLMPTYHPAFLLRNQAITEKRKVWEDMLQVMEKLGLPISEKQRGYFLKSS